MLRRSVPAPSTLHLRGQFKAFVDHKTTYAYTNWRCMHVYNSGSRDESWVFNHMRVGEHHNANRM